MAYFSKGNGLVREVIRNPRLATKKAHLPGKYYAFNDSIDGYSGFEIETVAATPTEKEFLEGNADRTTLVLPNDITDVAANIGTLFPNLSVIIVQNTSQVVSGLPDIEATAIVPNTLESSYEADATYSGYSDLTFDSWSLSTSTTIPYIGNSELTLAYVKLFADNAGGNASVVDKVIVPPEFTSFESGAISEIRAQFENMTEIEIQAELTYTPSQLTALMASETFPPKVSFPNLTVNDTEWRHFVGFDVGSDVVEFSIKNLTNTRSYTPAGGWNANVQGTNLEKFVVLGKIGTRYVPSFYNWNVYGNVPNPTPKLKYIDLGDLSEQTNVNNATAGISWQPQTGISENTLLARNIINNLDVGGMVLSHDSLVHVIDNLYDYSGGSQHTLTIGATNLAKLSAAEIQVATDKNWVLA